MKNYTFQCLNSRASFRGAQSINGSPCATIDTTTITNQSIILRILCTVRLETYAYFGKSASGSPQYVYIFDRTGLSPPPNAGKTLYIANKKYNVVSYFPTGAYSKDGVCFIRQSRYFLSGQRPKTCTCTPGRFENTDEYILKPRIKAPPKNKV